MHFPVYPFRLVLKELRHDAGLTVLAAAEATDYRNYERWESGATKVGAQHVRSIAEAFGVTDERWLLIYAWLVDRLTPRPGKSAVDLADVNIRRVIRDLPSDVIDLGVDKQLMVEPGRHRDVALMCLHARYRRRERTVLAPVRRSPLPARRPGESVLETAYGDVLVDGTRLVARTLITGASRGVVPMGEPAQAILANIAPMLSSPEAVEALAEEAAGPFEAEARRFADLLRWEQRALAAIIESASGQPAAPEAVADLAMDVAAGRIDRVIELMIAAADKDALPEVDPAMIAEAASIFEQVKERWDDQARQEIADGLERLGTEGLFDALEVMADASHSS